MARIWSHVKVGKKHECWEWTGARVPKGYGNTWLAGKTLWASRAVWLITFGDIPKGLAVCHECHNPPCCNPFHLHLATPGQNIKAAYKAYRMPNQLKTHCGRGHEYSGENLYVSPSGIGGRRCNECRRICSRVRRAKTEN